MRLTLTEDEKRELLRIARQAIRAAIDGEIYVPSKPLSKNLETKAGAFVTLKEKGELRGCIGLIEARYPLYQATAEMAEKSAMCDPRFESVGPDEFDDLKIEISVLSPLSRIHKVEEVEVGQHGIIVEKGFYRGLLLPQVAAENNWTREEFLEYTCVKAGLRKETYKDPDARLYIFYAEVFGENELGIVTEEELGKRK